MLISFVAFALLCQSLAPEAIMQAIADGPKKVKDAVVQIGHDDAGHFRITLTGPYQRVMLASYESSQQYKPLAVADLPAEVTAPALEVVAVPGRPLLRPYSGWDVTPPATHIVLKTKSGQVIQPTTVTPFPYAWTNAMGGQFSSGGAKATFTLADVPNEELEVVVVTAAFAYTRTLKAKDRAKIR